MQFPLSLYLPQVVVDRVSCVAALFVRTVCGDPTGEMDRVVRGSASFVNERMCIDDWSFYYLTEAECRERIASADIRFVADADDPGPQRKLDRYIRQQRVKRWLRKCLKK